MPGTTKNPTSKLLRVFVSSTSVDLEDYRRAAGEEIQSVGWHPVMMEHFGANPAPTTLEACREMLWECDVVLLILAHRRGWVPTKEQGGDGVRSITEHELAFARQCDIPVYVLMASETWPGNLWETDDPQALAAVKKFRSSLNRVVDFFDYEQPTAQESKSLPAFRAKVIKTLVAHKDRLQRADSSAPVAKTSGSSSSDSVTLRMETVRLVDEGAIRQAIQHFGRSWPDVAIEWPPSVWVLIEGLKAGLSGPLTGEGAQYFAAHVPAALTWAEDSRVRIAKIIPGLIKRSGALSDLQLSILLRSMLLFGNYHAHSGLVYHAGWLGLAPWKAPAEWDSLRMDHNRSGLASLLGEVQPGGVPCGRLMTAAGKMLYDQGGSPGHYVYAPQVVLEHPDDYPNSICKWLIPQLEIEMLEENLPSSYKLTGWCVDKILDTEGKEKR